MLIEELKISDIDKYKELIDNCFGSSNDISLYRDGYENKNYNILVCKIDSKIVGSITYIKVNLFTFSNQPFIEVFNVATHSEYRRKGISKLLMEYIFDMGSKKGYKSVFLTCLESAVDAHNFYEDMGFKKVDSRKYSKKL